MHRVLVSVSNTKTGGLSMKLSELIPHTAVWTGVSDTHVNTVARVLRQAGLISSQGRGPGGALMTNGDKINLLLGTCGVEYANRAAEYVRVWRNCFRADTQHHPDLNFAFLKAGTVEDLLINLITKDLNGGPLSAWLKESDSAYAKTIGRKTATNHSITLDFYVDMFALELVVSRHEFSAELGASKKAVKVTTHPISIKFAPPPPPLNIPVPPRYSENYMASSDLIRRLHEKNLVGWGHCF
jgi:hypothetical protein